MTLPRFIRLEKFGWPLVGFALLNLLLFLPLPWRGELPGNTDTLVAISLSNLILEKAQLFLGGIPSFTALYPARDVLAYGENCYGLALIFIIFKILTRSDIWGYYFFLCTLFTLNAFAVYKLASLFVKEEWIAVLSGIAFSLAGFTLANVDDPNVVFVFFPVLAMYFLEKGIRDKRGDYLTTGFLLSGLQIWFGFYIFTFQLLVVVLFCLVSGKDLLSMLDLKRAVGLLITYSLPAAPLLGLYLYNHTHANVVSPYLNSYDRLASSLRWYNFYNVLPGNLLYSSKHNIYGLFDVSWFHSLRKHCFPGILLPTFSLLGILRAPRLKKKAGVLIAVFLVFFILSFGVNLPYFDAIISLPLGDYFRIPLRLYLFALLSLSIFFGIGLEACLIGLSSRSTLLARALVVLVGVGFILENVPFHARGVEYRSLIRPPVKYQKFFEKYRERRIVLDLPSTYIARLPDKERIWTYSREALYMNWQTYHKQIIVAGTNSYIPASRVEMDDYVKRLPEKTALDKVREIGVSHIVFHKNLILIPSEDILNKLRHSRELTLVDEDETIAIFEMSPGREKL